MQTPVKYISIKTHIFLRALTFYGITAQRVSATDPQIEAAAKNRLADRWKYPRYSY